METEDVLDTPSSKSETEKEESLTVVHICNICDKQFESKNTLNQHMENVHLLQKFFSCHLCNRKFAAKVELDNHLKSLHSSKDRTLREEKNAGFDIRNVQSEIRTWICDLCGAELRSKRGMQTHLLIHQVWVVIKMEILSYLTIGIKK